MHTHVHKPIPLQSCRVLWLPLGTTAHSTRLSAAHAGTRVGSHTPGAQVWLGKYGMCLRSHGSKGTNSACVSSSSLSICHLLSLPGVARVEGLPSLKGKSRPSPWALVANVSDGHASLCGVNCPPPVLLEALQARGRTRQT